MAARQTRLLRAAKQVIAATAEFDGPVPIPIAAAVLQLGKVLLDVDAAPHFGATMEVERVTTKHSKPYPRAPHGRSITVAELRCPVCKRRRTIGEKKLAHSHFVCTGLDMRRVPGERWSREDKP